jgi:hypothetical protein
LAKALQKQESETAMVSFAARALLTLVLSSIGIAGLVAFADYVVV